jgi:nitrogen regulatory protein P-II 1
MKKIEAIIKPYKLDDIKKALNDAGIQGMTVSEVKGFGRQKGHTEVYRGATLEINFVPKIKIETVLPESKVDEAIRIIMDKGKTGEIGDGKIFVLSVENAVRIRTGEIGEAAA